MPELPAMRPWEEITHPIRENVSGKYIERAGRAYAAGLYDAAINYIWDLVVNDLRQKVERYGVDIFLSVEDGTKYFQKGATLQDRWRDIGDHRLLSGCLKLNLITRTGHRHLSHMLAVRSHESAAHPVDDEDEVDRETANTFAHDAVRFVLSRELPEPGFSLHALAENIRDQDLVGDAALIIEQIQNLPTAQTDSALSMCASEYIGGDSQTKRNVELIAVDLWSRATNEAKQKIGEKFARLVLEGQQDEKTELFGLLVIVKGISCIPTGLRKAMFVKASQKLIDAHSGWDNFVNEVAPARQLADLGVDCPEDGLPIFCEAFLVSRIGNSYGKSHGAQQHLELLEAHFSTRHWSGIIEAVRSSDTIRSKLADQRPYSQLGELLKRGLPNLVVARDKEDCEFIIENPPHMALRRFG